MRAYRASLDDGTEVFFRVLRREDASLLEEGFRHLSPESRYTRFFRQITELSEQQLRYLTDIDLKDHFAWVAIAAGEAPQGAGVVRWIRMRDEPQVAEVAVTVIDSFQRKGLGRTLLILAAISAVENGIERFRAWILGHNVATLGMLEKMGGRRGRWESGVLELDIPLPSDVEAIEKLAPLPLRKVPEHPEPDPG